MRFLSIILKKYWFLLIKYKKTRSMSIDNHMRLMYNKVDLCKKKQQKEKGKGKG